MERRTTYHSVLGKSFLKARKRHNKRLLNGLYSKKRREKSKRNKDGYGGAK